jgi:hypothetical protein
VQVKLSWAWPQALDINSTRSLSGRVRSGWAFTASHRKLPCTLLHCRAASLPNLFCIHRSMERNCEPNIADPLPILSQRSPTNLGSGFQAQHLLPTVTVPHTGIHHQHGYVRMYSLQGCCPSRLVRLLVVLCCAVPLGLDFILSFFPICQLHRHMQPRIVRHRISCVPRTELQSKSV